MFTTFWCYIEIFFLTSSIIIIRFFFAWLLFLLLLLLLMMMIIWWDFEKAWRKKWLQFLFSYSFQLYYEVFKSALRRRGSKSDIIKRHYRQHDDELFSLLPRKKKRKQNCHLILCLFVSANTYNQQHQTSTSKISKHTFLKMFLLRWNKQKKEREET